MKTRSIKWAQSVPPFYPTLRNSASGPEIEFRGLICFAKSFKIGPPACRRPAEKTIFSFSLTRILPKTGPEDRFPTRRRHYESDHGPPRCNLDSDVQSLSKFAARVCSTVKLDSDFQSMSTSAARICSTSSLISDVVGPSDIERELRIFAAHSTLLWDFGH